MSQYMDEVAPDVVSPGDNKALLTQPLKHLDTVIALYDFPGTQPSHLPLTLGDTVYVLSKNDSGWWDGVVINNLGELMRGWFPNNYVRSVNYVQPVLNKLKSNKELDSITAANTAANVLIPSFTNLLQKNLGDSGKNSPADSSRKNSVVSFASSDTSNESNTNNTNTNSATKEKDKERERDIRDYFKQQHPSPFGSPKPVQRESSPLDPLAHVTPENGEHLEHLNDIHDHDPTFNSFSSTVTSIIDNSENYLDPDTRKLSIDTDGNTTASKNTLSSNANSNSFSKSPSGFNNNRTPNLPGTPQFNPAFDDGSFSNHLNHDTLTITPTMVATTLLENYRKEFNRTPTWITKSTNNGNLVFFCPQLNIYCEEMPLMGLSLSDLSNINFEIPGYAILKDSNTVVDNDNMNDRSNLMNEDPSKDLNNLFKRDSNGSISSTNSNTSSIYHHFRHPLYSMDDLFCYSPSDIRYWTDLKDQFFYILDLSFKCIKDHNKLLFHKNFGKLNKLLSILASSVRLSQHDFQNTKYENSIKRKLRRICSTFSQIYLNSILQLSYLHYDLNQGGDGDSDQLFSYDLSKLNKSTSVSTNFTNSISTNNSSISTIRQLPINSIKSGDFEDEDSENPDAPKSSKELTYLQAIEIEVFNIKSNLHSLIKLFLKLTRDKKFQVMDYDGSSSDTDNEPVNENDPDSTGLGLESNKAPTTFKLNGKDRSNILPQNYPRLIANEFNGGNWCNPFFESDNPILNASGNDLKNKYHQKVLIDRAAFQSIKKLVGEMVNLSQETLSFLKPENQHLYYNKGLKDERNTSILRLIYKYLYFASSVIDVMESFDFTVFCLIKRFNSQEDELETIMKRFQKTQEVKSSITSKEEDNQQEDYKDSDDSKEKQDEDKGSVQENEGEHQQDTKQFSSNLSFDYPVVLEFFHYKQEFHHLISNVIMATQSLTLEDPDVFKGMKDEDNPLYYNRDLMKNPNQKATLLLTNLLIKQLNSSKGDSISLNTDTLLMNYLLDGNRIFDEVLAIVKNLIDERDTILNYATRVMHDDFNVQLLVIERNNTMSSDQKEDVNNSFITGKKNAKDIPWYLEGDDEFDLLSDMNNNIKGGTKEALICHLTHHDLFDSNFNSAFLLTFATMMPLNELLNFLMMRFNIEAPEGLSYEEYNLWISKKQSPIRLRVLNIMKLLLEKYWSNSYHNELSLNKWLQFLQGSNVQSFSISKTLISHLNKLLRGEVVMVEREPVVSGSRTPAPLTRPSLVKKLKLLDIDYIEFARQITIREFKLYSKITKFQCLAKIWGKKSGLSESIENISNFIKASNQLTNFVAYMILRKQETKKRVQIIRYFVQVAERCRQYNNFSSMTAIISALYSSPIHRLKKTWKYVSNDTLTHLQNMNKLMNSSRNFNEYRDVLKFIGAEPCVPFFGVYLTDLTFVYHGNPDTLLNRTRMINFSKRGKTSDILLGLDRFKLTGYNLLPVPEIQKYLDGWLERCPTIDEQYQLSLNLEPRDNNTSNNNNNNNQRQKPSFPFSRS